MKMTRALFIWGTVLCACACPPKAPATETPPADLAQKVFIVEQPASDGPATGAWVTVSGWFDPAKVQHLLVMGAPVEGFYTPTGHGGVPTVPVLVRADGRFFAPRVPLQNGATTVTLVPLSRGGAGQKPISLNLTVTDAASVPATLVVDPPQPEPGQKARLRAATAESTSLTWQWDFDSDGTFDAEGGGVDHAWPAPGRYAVTARTKIASGWVSAWAEVTVGAPPAVTATTHTVAMPTRLFAIPKFARDPQPGPDGLLPMEVKATRYLAAIDGDAVQVFDAALAPLFTLQGLKGPSAVTGDDQGRLYVADTGHDRIVRFTPSGALDPSFGTAGAFSGTASLPLTRPIALAIGQYSADIVLESGKRLDCAVANAPMGDWTQATCGATQLGHSGTFRASGMTTVTRGVVKPTYSFPAAGQLTYFVAPPKLVSAGRGSYALVDEALDTIDVAPGPDDIRRDLLTVDSVGRVHQHRLGRRTATWQFDYAATCIAAGADGKVYVGGPGRIELRAFEVHE
jgi:hypothetical protein